MEIPLENVASVDPSTEETPSNLPSESDYKRALKMKRKTLVVVIGSLIAFTCICLLIGGVVFMTERSSNGNKETIIRDPSRLSSDYSIPGKQLPRIPMYFGNDWRSETPAIDQSVILKPLTKKKEKFLRKKTTTSVPLVKDCFKEGALHSAFKHICYSQISTAEFALKHRCSNVYRAMLCLKSRISTDDLLQTCTEKEVARQLTFAGSATHLTKIYDSVKQTVSQCINPLSTYPAKTGLKGIEGPTKSISSVCLQADKSILNIYYGNQCYIYLWPPAKNLAAKCRQYYQTLACVSNPLLEKFPACTFQEVHGILSYDMNRRFYQQTYHFFPEQCPVRDMDTLPEPLMGPCNHTTPEVFTIFKRFCSKTIDPDIGAHKAFYCRSFATTIRCVADILSNETRSNETEKYNVKPSGCSLQAVKKVLTSKLTQHYFENTYGFNPVSCDEISTPACQATDDDIMQSYKERCISVLQEASNDTKGKCEAMPSLYGCVSHTLNVTHSMECSAAAVRWHLESSRFDHYFQEKFGFVPLQCTNDFVSSTTVAPETCSATTDEIISSLYSGCIWKLLNINSLKEKCSAYEQVANCSSENMKQNNVTCDAKGVMNLLELKLNDEYMNKTFKFLPTQCKEFLEPISSISTTTISTTLPAWFGTDMQEKACTNHGGRLSTAVVSCSSILKNAEQLANVDYCSQLPFLAECVRGVLNKEYIRCSGPAVYKALKSQDLSDYFLTYFHFDATFC